MPTPRCTAFADFYPRPPRGGRRGSVASKPIHKIFLSTPSARRATTSSKLIKFSQTISIHALREEGDVSGADSDSGRTGFLSTPSARRATCRPACILLCGSYFYPRPPRGGRRLVHLFPAAFESISIHALREEGDGRPHHHGIYYGLISIHALREEGDVRLNTAVLLYVEFLSTPSARRATCQGVKPRNERVDFYPRPPRGGRRRPADPASPHHQFLSTPSARRATADGQPRPSP